MDEAGREAANGTIKVAAAQIAPVLLDRQATLAKVVQRVHEAAGAGCQLVAFGEAIVPGDVVVIRYEGPN